MTSHKGFDRLAWMYDFLVRIVFGQSIRKAQVELVRHAQKERHWLVIGGGTGWILDEILKHDPIANITYLEASQKMIDRAKNRSGAGDVHFVLGSVDQIPDDQSYDLIVTNFFWDMFATDKAILLKSKIELRLKNEAQWLVADFKNTDIWWQRALIKLMYWFFRATCNIEAKQLPDFDRLFTNENEIYKSNFHHGMIESVIYQKMN